MKIRTITPSSAVAFRDAMVAHCHRQDDEFLEKQSSSPHHKFLAQFSEGVGVLIPFLKRAEIVIWRSQYMGAAIRGMEAFADVPLSPKVYQRNTQLWFTDDGFPFAISAAHEMNLPSNAGVAAIMIHPAAPLSVLMVTLIFCARDDDTPYFRGFKIPYDSHGLTYSWLSACCEFLDLKVVAQRKERLPRYERRQRAREGLDADPDIRVVTLREAERDADCESSSEFAYACRFLVGGHFRKQWYPSEQAHKVIYIQPFMKGPRDAPFKEPKQNVFVVNR